MWRLQQSRLGSWSQVLIPLKSGDIVDVEFQLASRMISPPAHRSEFPSAPGAGPHSVDCSYLTSVKKSVTGNKSAPCCLLRHLREYVRAGEYVFADGTVIVFEEPQIVASGILGQEKLDRLMKALAGCQKLKVDVFDFPGGTMPVSLPAGASYPVNYESLTDANCKAVYFWTDQATLMPSRQDVSRAPKLLKWQAPFFKEANVVELLQPLRLMLAEIRETVLSSAERRLFYESRQPSDAIYEKVPVIPQSDVSGTLQTRELRFSETARDFPVIDGIRLSDIGPDGLQVSKNTYIEHRDFFDKLRRTHRSTYWREGDWVYSGLDLYLEPLPPVKL
jgi:hypothetical protein